nr:bifunctional phosphopantothenoylcysteine decarboxylase/phosphopantothenate--cysteine ligase CoaBC [bacterium]
MKSPDLRALKGKTVVLGVCGGIAVYKAVEVMRLLIHTGAEVFVVMTESAQRFVTPLTFETLSGHPVYTDMFELLPDGGIGHIALAERADLVLVAPATANMIGKAACAIADDPLSTLLVATRAKVLWAPAMNVHMWENPLVQENLRRLERHGACVLEPATGMLACGREGKGKFPAPEKVAAKAAELLGENALLRGETVLISAGPTWERIDPVRFVGNFSSGKMGYALAREAVKLGARVLLVSGPVALEPPELAQCVMVESACEMRQAVLDWLDEASIVIMAAAVADYRPARIAPQKIKKEGSEGL